MESQALTPNSQTFGAALGACGCLRETFGHGPFDVQWPQRCIVKVSRQQQTLDRRFVLARQAGGKKWFKNWFQTRSAAASTDLEKVENAPKSRVRPEASSSWPLGSLKLSLDPDALDSPHLSAIRGVRSWESALWLLKKMQNYQAAGLPVKMVTVLT